MTGCPPARSSRRASSDSGQRAAIARTKASTPGSGASGPNAAGSPFASYASAAARSELRFATRTCAPWRAAARADRRAMRPAPTTSTRFPRSGPVTGTIRSRATSASERGGPSRQDRVSRPRWRAIWNSRSRTGWSPIAERFGEPTWTGHPTAPGRWRSDRHSRSWWRIWSSPTTTLSRPAATVNTCLAAAMPRSRRAPSGSAGRRSGPTPSSGSSTTNSSTRWQVRSRIARGSFATCAAASANASRASLGTKRACATRATRPRVLAGSPLPSAGDAADGACVSGTRSRSVTRGSRWTGRDVVRGGSPRAQRPPSRGAWQAAGRRGRHWRRQ